jgi:hypothetical protein
MDPGLYVAFLLFYVGWIFILNGLHALNLPGTKEAALWNFVISTGYIVVPILGNFRLGQDFRYE